MPEDEGSAFALADLGDWRIGRFAALGEFPGLAHAVTTRHGLDVEVARSDRAAAASLVAERLGLDAVAYANQVHGADVLAVGAGGPAGDADGLVTDVPGLGVMAFSADCPLLLVADSAGPAVGVAQSSWRGTLKGMPSRLIEAMTERFGASPAVLVACIGPSAGPCCYEVGGEVLAAAVDALGLGAERFFRARPNGKYLFDLWAACRDQLLRAGLRRRNVHTAALCTLCRNDLFPSYRVEGPLAGRFVAALARPR